MTYSYIYSYADFINSGGIINIEDMQGEIISLNLASATILYINSGYNPEFATDIVDMIFSNQLDGSDKILLDDYVDNYQGISPRTDMVCKISDIKTPGTNGGTFEKDIWITRDLNTIDGNVDFVSLSNNIMTIQPGKYIFTIRAPSCNSGNNQIRLYNITNSTSTLGQNAFSDRNVMSYSELHQVLTFNTETELKVEHICSIKTNGFGFGKASGYDVSEIYTTIMIQMFN